MKNYIFPATLLIVIGLLGCRNVPRGEHVDYTGDEVQVLSSEITKKQFADLPIPANFAIQDGSYGTQTGTFRMGRLNYSGTLAPAKVESYLTERMPEHGWTLAFSQRNEGNVLNMKFRKGNTLANYRIWTEGRQTGKTRIFILLETKVSG